MGRRIESKTVKTGRNAEHPGYADDRYIKCKRCGFVCHLDRDDKSVRGSREGDGVTYPDIVDYDETTVTYDGTDNNYDNKTSYDGYRNDLTVERGCPLCGTLLYYEEVEDV